MTLTLFITLFAAFSTATGFITESVKRVLDEKAIKYSANLIAVIVACVTGIGGTAAYYGLQFIPFNASNIICMVLMGIAVAVGSMVGYDKVTQLIEQVKGTK